MIVFGFTDERDLIVANPWMVLGAIADDCVIGRGDNKSDQSINDKHGPPTADLQN